MASGWTHWILEQYEFPYEIVYAPALDAGNLKAEIRRPDLRRRRDSRAASGDGPETGDFGGRGGQGRPNVPDEFKLMIGRVTAEKTIPQLRAFLEAGGTILAIGSSTGLAGHLELPVANHLVEKTADGRESPSPLGRSSMFPAPSWQPGWIRRIPWPTGWPKSRHLLRQQPGLRLRSGSGAQGLHPVAWFENKNPLRSGWVWGDQYLRRGDRSHRSARRQGQTLSLRPRDRFPRPAARDVQARSSTGSSTARPKPCRD